MLKIAMCTDIDCLAGMFNVGDSCKNWEKAVVWCRCI